MWPLVILLTDSGFDGSVYIAFSLTTCPGKETCFCKRQHFLGLILRLADLTFQTFDLDFQCARQMFLTG